MSIPLRVSENLFKQAEIEGGYLNRSAAKQVEYWAKLGQKVADSLTTADVLALLQGVAELRVNMPQVAPLNTSDVFQQVREANVEGHYTARSSMYYESTAGRLGFLDQVMPDGTRQTGRFSDGSFQAE